MVPPRGSPPALRTQCHAPSRISGCLVPNPFVLSPSQPLVASAHRNPDGDEKMMKRDRNNVRKLFSVTQERGAPRPWSEDSPLGVRPSGEDLGADLRTSGRSSRLYSSKSSAGSKTTNNLNADGAAIGSDTIRDVSVQMRKQLEFLLKRQQMCATTLSYHTS